MLVGYGRVSTADQNPALQEDVLRAAGCEKLYIETVSSGKRDRPQLAAALDYVLPVTPLSSGVWTGLPGRSDS